MKKDRIEIRVSILEKKIITNMAAHTGLSVGEYIRQCALGRDIKYRLTEDEVEIYKTLSVFKNNFTLISNLYKHKNHSINSEVRKVTDEIKKHLDKFI